MAKKISQSDTRWVKKAGQRGYVEQISTGKRVTGKVRLVTDTTKGTAGQTRTYSKGRDVTGSKSNKATQAPATSAGRARTSDSTKTPEVTKLPGGMTRKQASQFASFKAGTEGRRSGASAAPPASLTGGSSGSTSKSTYKSRTQNLKRTSGYKKAQDRLAQARVASQRQGAAKKAAFTAINPLGSSAESFFKLSGGLGKSIRTSAKNWWEGK